MDRKSQELAQLEYCFSQYFSRYCAPVIVKDFNYYNRKQSEEYNRALQNHANAFVPIYAQLKAAQDEARSTEWGKKTVDDFINAVSGKIASNKQFAKDWNRLIDEYEGALIRKIGKRGYYNAGVALQKKLGEKEWVSPAFHYGQMRFVQLLKEQLARTTMPKSSLEYVLKEAVSNNSLFGMVALRVARGRGLSDTEEELLELEKKSYNPSKKEKAAAWVAGAAIDVATTGGSGTAATAGKTLAVNTAFNAAGPRVMGWLGLGGVSSQKEYSKIVFGNEDTLGKLQKGGSAYRKNGTEYISKVNDGLGKKIKVAPMRTHVSNDTVRKDSNQLMGAAAGNSTKLLKSISAGISKQALPYNGKAQIPVWMLHKTSRQCRTFATTFFSIARQMSAQGLRVYNVNGHNFTLAQVSQRAYDYARAAVQIDRTNAEKQTAKAAVHRRSHSEPKQESAGHANTHHEKETSPSVGKTPVRSAPVTASQLPQGTGQSPQNTTMAAASPNSNMPQMAGWSRYLDNAGLNGFGDVGKNLGYVFAMLPDMLIGMFTGKTSSFTLENNILPLAAIAAGMFSKNPLVKLMMMGFGGLNILNNAGHEALGLSEPKQAVPKNYKQYADEPLNPRLGNVFMRGRSLIAEIDNKPVVINISDDAADAYEKKAVPLNTLANAVLRKYDESMATASSSYDRSMAEVESQDRQRSYGLK